MIGRRPQPRTWSGARAGWTLERVARRVGAPAGIVGSLALAGTVIATAAVYRGRRDELYSPLNHWVSELGETGVSSLAGLFNAGLIVSGICLAVFMASLAATRTGRLRFVYGGVGMIAGAAGALVGAFPMNTLGTHALVALTFFDLGWIAVGLASVDFVRRPESRFPARVPVVGGVVTSCFVVFLVAMATAGVDTEQFASPAARPDVWSLPILEWLVVVGITAWVLVAGLTWLRAERREPTS